ncbi:methylated-DNA--[protein]-cysteine S-methyltransferase [Nakamurella flavida]|uniref:Methylated-DNA--protein-cysteine methyltransferase n=1 Tax=Nakamurella flavida TaxID=363630 RepID=A0A938YJE4_9ACTN|nr:methylated-DNA--[protein]-cysteine S-methyltransferase [Nakamurella flavida]MBM9475691.1 methylated-DNA--[protein]-cysteine S-methyltransferase [Nakamurella flavida]MDP9778032.1 methylated-DNA-[protein]-cysteine S-methyltransferase [Nakamurella flavida]
MSAESGDRRHAVLDSPVGPLTVVAGREGLTGVYFADHLRRPDTAGFGPAVDPVTDELLDRAARQLGEYFLGDRRAFDLPLAPAGAPFQRAVWDLLTGIPYGETRSYGALARRLGDVGLARAVGTANGANPLSVVVPCHRVVGSDGSLTGYAGGLARKRLLLDLERPGSTLF